MRHALTGIFAGALLSYVGLGTILYFRQDALIYASTQKTFPESEAQAKASGFEPWRNVDGECVGWQSSIGDSSNVLLIFHGNGIDALQCPAYWGRLGHAAGNWKIFLLEYPGYGCRPGKPSEQSLTEAAVQALDILSASGRKIWIASYSLGSGVACAAARERPRAVAGILLLTPFKSLSDTAASYYPWFPVAPFLRTRFESDKNLKNYPGPVGILLSGKDTTIPPEQGRALYNGYKGRKRLWIDPETDHDATPLLQLQWAEILRWLKE